MRHDIRVGTRVVWLVAACTVVAGSLALDAQGRLRDRARARQFVRAEEPKTITVGGQRRTYLVHDFSRTRPAPLVFVLHGGGGNAENAVSMTGFDRVGEREGLIVVYPNGTAARPRAPLLTWN